MLIPLEVAGSAVSGAVGLLLEDPDLGEVFGWLRPEVGTPHDPRGGTRLFAVAEKGCGVIGLAALSSIHREAGYARLSCAVAAPYRLSGAGHWAATELIRRGMRLEGLRHVEAFVHAGNDTARRVLESLGFRAQQTSVSPGEAPPPGHLCLRLDLPTDSKGHFLMPVSARPSSRAVSA
ncbi:GNAT family N-acetyltransferase [Pyxidicoccus parkwayensis]|uniref:GNAT family N-acetyltransferase n=1 Tax=Pyxidicoccus parkwayensis TaxID=2813578 RepID=A0ABX7NQE2_9BACT|nr:GNAT family N-acetyltransferase [Pyxidicoccus parkwaysis]QSQ20646.1 GNAT family N-acetyltransferase [Pyxidicoccus parkwaysis]